jgi:hypothetical protein
MIKKAEPCVVYLPRPATDRLKIQGHIMEQNKPPLRNAYIATVPVVSVPITIAAMPNKEKINSVRAGLSLLI